MVDHKGIVIGDDDEPIPSRLLNPCYLVRHPTGDAAISQIHDSDHWGLVGVPLELGLVQGETTLPLGNDYEFEKTVLYVGDSGLFSQGTQLCIRRNIQAV
jgi:hypothetical protein